MRGNLKAVLATAAAVVLGVTGASAATYNISWTGSGGYSMAGVFAFDDALLGGIIDETQIDELAIEVFLNGVSKGSRSLSADGFGGATFEAAFNLNFDSAVGQFNVGGGLTSSDGQVWFAVDNNCDTVGFSSGSSTQSVCVEGARVAASALSTSLSTLTATPVAIIPLPAALPLFLAGLAGLGFVGWRTNRRAALA
jgi:hypothetical protein